MVEQPREIVMPTQRPNILIDQASWQRPTALPKRHIAQRLVRPERVVIGNPRLHDMGEMAKIEAQELIETLLLEHADPRLSEGVGDRRKERCFGDLGAVGFGHRVEASAELGVVVVDNEPQIEIFLVQSHRDVAGLKLHPRCGQPRGDANHCARRQSTVILDGSVSIYWLADRLGRSWVQFILGPTMRGVEPDEF